VTDYQAKITSKGQITLPARLRKALALEPGDQVVFVEESDGSFRIETKRSTLADLRGIIKHGRVGITRERIEAMIEESRAARWVRGAGRGRRTSK
jgi:antitoxin PrlF